MEICMGGCSIFYFKTNVKQTYGVCTHLHKSSSGSGDDQICLAPGGFALWTPNRVLPLHPAGGLGSPQTPLLVEASMPAAFSYSPAT